MSADFILAQDILSQGHQAQQSLIPMQLNALLFLTVKYAVIKQPPDLDLDLIQQVIGHNFYVWRYGIIDQPVYDHYRIYCTYPITENWERQPSSLFLPLQPFLQTVFQRTWDAFALVRLCHQDAFYQRFAAQITGWRSTINCTYADFCQTDGTYLQTLLGKTA